MYTRPHICSPTIDLELQPVGRYLIEGFGTRSLLGLFNLQLLYLLHHLLLLHLPQRLYPPPLTNSSKVGSSFSTTISSNSSPNSSSPASAGTAPPPSSSSPWRPSLRGTWAKHLCRMNVPDQARMTMNKIKTKQLQVKSHRLESSRPCSNVQRHQRCECQTQFS
jgi:hypothetical protein